MRHLAKIDTISFSSAAHKSGAERARGTIPIIIINIDVRFWMLNIYPKAKKLIIKFSCCAHNLCNLCHYPLSTLHVHCHPPQVVVSVAAVHWINVILVSIIECHCVTQLISLPSPLYPDIQICIIITPPHPPARISFN